MKIGFVGLGKMGGNMVLRLLEKKFEVVGYNRTFDAVKKLVPHGMIPSSSLDEMVGKLGKSRKVVWLMVPAGEAVKEVLFDPKSGLINFLEKGDIVIDGGNSFYKNTKENSSKLAEKGIIMLDSGTSGGPAGALKGLCLMIGGERGAYEDLSELWKALSVENGYGYMGTSGAGHYVKMVHNAVEYGFLEAIGEGFGLLEQYDEKLELDDIARLWSNGSVVESKLMKLAALALSEKDEVQNLDPYIDDNRETRWAVSDAIDREVPMTAIAYSLFARYDSRGRDAFAKKLIAALRKEFGGHDVRKMKEA